MLIKINEDINLVINDFVQLRVALSQYPRYQSIIFKQILCSDELLKTVADVKSMVDFFPEEKECILWKTLLFPDFFARVVTSKGILKFCLQDYKEYAQFFNIKFKFHEAVRNGSPLPVAEELANSESSNYLNSRIIRFYYHYACRLLSNNGQVNTNLQNELKHFSDSLREKLIQQTLVTRCIHAMQANHFFKQGVNYNLPSELIENIKSELGFAT